MPFSTIISSEIAAYSDVESNTFIKLKGNDDFFKAVMDGTDSEKIVAQAVETQASGSGVGLKISQFNHRKASGSVAISSNGDTIVSTGIPYNAVQVPVFGISPQQVTGTAVYRPRLQIRPNTSTNWELVIARTGDNSTAHDVDWVFATIQVS